MKFRSKVKAGSDHSRREHSFLGMEDNRCDLIFAGLFTVLTLLQILAVVVSPFDLAADEAHYWEWSRHLDWSYYSKGPLIAWVIAGFSYLPLEPFYAVKAGGLFFAAATSLLFYVFARQLSAPGLALVGWIAMRSMPIFSTLGLFMTTDPLVAFFWLLALFSAFQALKNDKPRWWMVCALACGVGFWGKYTIAVLPVAFIVLLLFTPERRRHLFSWSFFISGVIFLLSLLPILVWNAKNGWVNFQHNAGHVLKSNGAAIKVQYVAELLGGQLGLLGPVLAIFLLISIYRVAGLWLRERDATAGVLLAGTVPLFFICFLVSLSRRVYVNWPMPGALAATMIFIYAIERGLVVLPSTRRVFSHLLGPSILISLSAYALFLGVTAGVPGRFLPTKKLVGWHSLGSDVKELVKARPDEPFVMATNYGVASIIAFYSGGLPVYCGNVDRRRMNQYDIWGGWHDLQGRDGVIVVQELKDIRRLKKHFSEIVPIVPESLKAGSLEISSRKVVYGNELLREFHYFLGRNFDGQAPDAPKGW